MMTVWNYVLLCIVLLFAILALRHLFNIVPENDMYINLRRVRMVLYDAYVQPVNYENGVRYKIECKYSYNVDGINHYGVTAIYGCDIIDNFRFAEILCGLVKSTNHVYVDRRQADCSFVLPNISYDSAHYYSIEVGIMLSALISLVLSLWCCKVKFRPFNELKSQKEQR